MKIELVFPIFVAILMLHGFTSTGVNGRSNSNCPTLTLPRGRVKIRSRGRIARFRCRERFKLYGSKMAVCIGENWSHPPPVCVADRCDDVTVVDDVIMTEVSGFKGAVLSFNCRDGFNVDGVDTIYCDGNTWNDDPPSCLRNEAERECDFEDSELCGWAHDSDDNFDWVWHTGATATARTGPIHDHTFENVNYGHYMYIEASSPRQPGDIARLLSPMYTSVDDVDERLCFSVWYHMLGPDMEDRKRSSY